MTSLVNALDSRTPLQLGENAHCEYGWSNDTQESICQLFFQLVRSSDYSFIKNKFEHLISSTRKMENKTLFITLCKIAAQTRDLEGGKGEYRLGWNLIHSFDKVGESSIAQKLIYYSVYDLPIQTDKCSSHPYGSWKDIKYLWSQFSWSQGTSTFMIKLINSAVKEDYDLIKNDKPAKSLVGKWVPRESSQFKKMFRELAIDYFPQFLSTCNKQSNPHNYAMAKRKCYLEYRKIISCINKSLHTVQINQCEGSWSEIDYEKNVTSITLFKQGIAFRNKTRKGLNRSEEKDRIEGAKNFFEWLDNKAKNNESIKGRRVGIVDLVEKAVNLKSYIFYSKEEYESLKNQINLQWNDNEKLNQSLENMIACVDVSGSMYGNPMNAAIGLGLRVANKSKLGRRVLTFSATPTWHILPEPDKNGKNDFVNDVTQIKSAEWGMNTNFTALLKLILDACIEKKLSNSDVSQLTLVIFSDMQIDYSDNESLNETMWKHIETLYKSAGYDKVPHILFWNLESTSGFPTLSNQKNVSMFSGFSPILLNQFCEKGIDFLNSVSPWSQIVSMLSHQRYSIFNQL